jgi:hypothetical protein
MHLRCFYSNHNLFHSIDTRIKVLFYNGCFSIIVLGDKLHSQRFTKQNNLVAQLELYQSWYIYRSINWVNSFVFKNYEF